MLARRHRQRVPKREEAIPRDADRRGAWRLPSGGQGDGGPYRADGARPGGPYRATCSCAGTLYGLAREGETRQDVLSWALCAKRRRRALPTERPRIRLACLMTLRSRLVL